MSKVAIAFMADYGRTHGKGLEVEAISSECKNLNILGDVYLRRKSAQDLAFTHHHQISVLPFGSFIFRLLTAIQSKIFKSFRSRYWQEKIFDLLVSTLLKNDSEMKVFYGVPRLVKSFKKAKTLGYTTVLHAAEMSSIHNIRLLRTLYGSHQPPAIWDYSLLEISAKTYKYVDFVIAHSEESRKSYIECGFDEDKVFVTPMGFDNKTIKMKSKYKESGLTKFLYIGNVTKMKGVHVILDAWTKIDTSSAELHICGSLYEDISDTFNEFVKLNDNVFYHGYVKPAEWFAKCDVFIFPSLSEGFSRVVVEAAASGIPVIVTKAATDQRLFADNENGFIIEATSGDLGNKMQMIIGDFQKIQDVGKRSSRDFSSLSWGSFGKNTAEILSSILRTHESKE